MVQCCAIPGCTVSSDRCKGVTFHNIPLKKKSSAKYQEWTTELIRIINRTDKNFNPKNARLCSRHFEDDCFKYGKLGNRTLAYGSLPTKFIIDRSTVMPVVSKVPRKTPIIRQPYPAVQASSSAQPQSLLHPNSFKPSSQVGCCAIGCSNTQRKDHNLKFPRTNNGSENDNPDVSRSPTVYRAYHKFPSATTQPDLYNKWKHNVNRKDFTPSQTTRVCSDHFENICFDYPAVLQRNFRYKVKPHAIPTLFNFKKAKDDPNKIMDQRLPKMHPCGCEDDVEIDSDAEDLNENTDEVKDDCLFSYSQLKKLDVITAYLTTALRELSNQNSAIEMTLIVKNTVIGGFDDVIKTYGSDMRSKSSTIVLEIVNDAINCHEEVEEDGPVAQRHVDFDIDNVTDITIPSATDMRENAVAINKTVKRTLKKASVDDIVEDGIKRKRTTVDYKALNEGSVEKTQKIVSKLKKIEPKSSAYEDIKNCFVYVDRNIRYPLLKVALQKEPDYGGNDQSCISTDVGWHVGRQAGREADSSSEHNYVITNINYSDLGKVKGIEISTLGHSNIMNTEHSNIMNTEHSTTDVIEHKLKQSAYDKIDYSDTPMTDHSSTYLIEQTPEHSGLIKYEHSNSYNRENSGKINSNYYYNGESFSNISQHKREISEESENNLDSKVKIEQNFENNEVTVYCCDVCCSPFPNMDDLHKHYICVHLGESKGMKS